MWFFSSPASVNPMSRLWLPEHLSGSSQVVDSQGFIINAGALYLGPDMKTTIHALHNYKIYIAVYGDFDLHLTGGRAFRSCTAVVIAPDRPHRIISRGVMCAAFYLVPETAEGRRVSRFFAGKEVFAPPSKVLAAILPPLRNYLEYGCSVEEANDVSNYLFNNLTPNGDAGVTLDGRVIRALEHLDSRMGHYVRITEVANEVALSLSRLEHLFKEQVGISISRYRLWSRTRAALMLMATRMPLTRVALEAGFSDSAHLSRTFRQMIGISPSTLLRTTRLYQSDIETT
ncbi:MAG TPA: helix-turn-helix domain-containing protein [Pyrinomonadaceae bacterium]|jgi:AraC-like DNA-binding protein|nr:helix-turn-helix domain-containing protein [Pyrinomonadaceae bacterium]